MTVFWTIITEISAAPYGDIDKIISSPVGAIDRLDENYYVNYPPPVQKTSLLGHLKRGYYYVDDGDITPVNPNSFNRKLPQGQRRQDAAAISPNSLESDNLPDGVRFTPLVRYKQTHTKRKKLFVPNFFG